MSLNLRQAAIATAMLVLLSSKSRAQGRNWQPQYETFNQLGCESQFKFNMVIHDIQKLTTTGNPDVDHYIAFTNHLLETPITHVDRLYSWDVKPEEHGPHSMTLDSYFSTLGYNLDAAITLEQPRAAQFNYFFVNQISYWNKNKILSVIQSWDIDKSCKLKLHDTEIKWLKIQSPNIVYWQDELRQGTKDGIVRTKTLPLPTDGLISFDLHESTFLSLEKDISQYKAIYRAGSYSAPLLKFSGFTEHDTDQLDPLLNRQATTRSFSATVTAGDIQVPARVMFSTDSSFNSLSIDNDTTWFVPLKFWLSGHIPQPNFSIFGSAVTYGNHAQSGEEPTSIIVTTNVREFTHYDHFNLYWKIANSSNLNGGRAVELHGGGVDRLSDYSVYPRWMAPQGSPYLAGSETVQTTLPYIQAIDREILNKIGDKANDAGIAASILSVLRGRFHYDEGALDIGGQVEYMTTAEIIKRKYITCTNYATLFAAIARSLGIPTRIVVGAVIYDFIGYHAWNEIEIADGVWVPVDATAGYPIFYKGTYLPFFVVPHDALNTDLDPSILPVLMSFEGSKSVYSVKVNATQPQSL